MVEAIVARYGYWMLFAGSAVEGDAFLITAVFLARRGYLQLTLTMVVAALGTSAANHIYYWVARRRGRQALDSLESNSRLARLTGRVARHSSWLLLVSRFVYGMRIAIPAACGATGMRPLTFTAIDLIGAAVWSVTIGFAGVAIGQALHLVVSDLHRHEWLVAGVLLFVVSVVIVLMHGRDWKGFVLVERLLAKIIRKKE